MKNSKIISLSLAIGGLLLNAPAFAALPVTQPALQSFRAIEFGANPAEKVDAVRADLAARIPAGSSVVQARALLRDAGAHCKPASAEGQVACNYGLMDVDRDSLRDVSWNVAMQTAQGKVVSLIVSRDPALD